MFDVSHTILNANIPQTDFISPVQLIYFLFLFFLLLPSLLFALSLRFKVIRSGSPQQPHGL